MAYLEETFMKRRVCCILIALILALQCLGCGADGQKETEISKDPLDPLTIMSLAGKDNSLDAYSAIVNLPLKAEEPEGAIAGGGSKVFLGASRAWYFKKHLFDIDRVDECWDEIAVVTAEGEKDSKGFDREHQVWGAGPVAGTDHYVTLHIEMREGEDAYRYFLVERDEKHEALKEITLNFLNGSDSSAVIAGLSGFAVDSSGMIHFTRRQGENWQYLLISPEGETLTEYVSKKERIGELVSLYDGRIAFWAVAEQNDEAQSRQTTLQCLDKETGKPVLLAAPEQGCYCFTLFNKDTLLYANREGIFRSDLQGNAPELLYRWINHGITVGGVPAMQADETGRIAVLYESAGNYNYLFLEPTTEEVEICKITLATSPARMSVYQPLVAAFNKQYPSCHIELKSSYDKTALLTELTAGNGPVLIDTVLTGFEEQEKLWEPLEEFLEQTEITKELVPSTLELGRINGTLYGVVTDFRLCTLVTGDPNLKDWDYDLFLQCVEDRPELEAIFNFYGGNYGSYFITGILSHGIDDSYFWDEETGTVDFDSIKFRKVLELAKKYCVREEGVKPGSSMLEGKVLCNELSIGRPEELALYRIYYGEDVNYIGYPTKDGGTHFIEGGGRPLAVRRTATKEEKAVACAFISLCLSYEGQTQAAKELNFALSVRRDMLEEQIAAMDQSTMPFVAGFDQIMLGADLNIELDRRVLLDLIDQAEPIKYLPQELLDILFEELDQYFSGSITEDMVINNLKSRVGLYLGERN